MAAGSAHVAVLTDTGTVWTWGYNASGQLGLGNTTSKIMPTEVLSISGIAAIAAGGDSTYVLKLDGTVWAWGLNSSGQLGDGTTTNRTSPVQVGSLTNVIAIAAGSLHAMALKSDGTLWAWGGNGLGQIGDNTQTNRTSPVQVTALGTSVLAMSASDQHSHAVKTDGTVWSWGRNQWGEAGDATTTSPRKLPVQTGSMTDRVKVEAGYYHAYAWDSSNNVKAWGYNVEGELGDGTGTNRTSPVTSLFAGVIALRGGYGHSVAALTDGTVKASGLNNNGQVGDGTTTNRTTPVTIAGLDGVVSVAAGTYFSAAVSSDGRVWTWGQNNLGQLGDGTTTGRLTPVQLSDAGFAWRVMTPSFSPNGGSFTANVTVTVATATPGATIHHKHPNGATLSKFDYTYDAVGNILTWRQQADSTATLWSYGYDAADQLTRAEHWTTATPPVILKRLAYAYDPAGNRTSEQIDDAVTRATYDNLNRLVAHVPGGQLTFAGTVSEPATVTIQGEPAIVDPANAFRGSASTVSGTNTTTIVAVDSSGNQATQQYQVSQSGASKIFTYDANGNLTSDGTRTFDWDARNQLVAVNLGTHRSEFTYNGGRQRVRTVDKENGVVQSDIKFVWCNGAICEERATDGSTVTRRVFADGEQVAGAARYFAVDHLGNVTEVSDETTAVLGRYAFDAWGRRTLTTGIDATTIGFTGHDWQASAGLWQTWYRAYDPELGRWISEDPAGFVDGPNRYAYVRNSPVRLFDPDGRQAPALPIILICSPDPVTKTALIAAGLVAGAVIVYKACEDGNCFGDNDKDKRKPPNTCQRLLELCLENPMQPPHRQKQWGIRKDCGACFRECNAAGGAWPFYKCPIF